jgi:hypothetical protein
MSYSRLFENYKHHFSGYKIEIGQRGIKNDLLATHLAFYFTYWCILMQFLFPLCNCIPFYPSVYLWHSGVLQTV